MAESFATGSDHQVVNELNGERLREPNEVFKRLGRAIRYNFQVDDAKFRRDNVKEIISTLVDNEVDRSQNKYDHFKEIEDKVEKGFKIARLNIKMKLINYLHWVLILMIIKIVQFFLIFQRLNIGNRQ